MLFCDWFTFTGGSFFPLPKYCDGELLLFFLQLHFYMELPEPSRMFLNLLGIYLLFL